MTCWLLPLFLGETFSDVVGSPYYVTPEVLHKHYGPKTDVWSAGVILYILLSGVPPFWTETELGIFRQILQGKLDFESEPWPGISDSAKDLIRKMLDRNPKRRLSAHEVLCHQWIVDDRVVPDKPLDSAVLSHLKQFSAMNKLKKMALRAFIPPPFHSIAECFAFLVCTEWSNPVIYRNSHTREASSSSSKRYLDWNSGLVIASKDQSQDRMCGLQDIGGHIMKVPIIGFQVLLCMHLEGTPAAARDIPLPVLFSPLFLLQCIRVLFVMSRLVEKIILLLRSGAATGQYFVFSSIVHECFGYLHRGSRFLGWWSIDEGSQEKQARLFQAGASGCSLRN
ncbi:hypothetical protein ACSBR1_026962 [Camellia fascicularis]